ncbi:MAG: ATP-binding cassette domain-containing protein, partial [Chloroflexota bacterium]
MESLIEMKSILKVFPPGLVALDNITTEFQKGEIHAIVGENGAGKSTLMKILYGMESRDDGHINFRGVPAKFETPGEAIQAGIGMVHQEILLVQEYTIWENIVLGVEPTNLLGRINKQEALR